MKIVLWFCQGLLAVVFLVIGGAMAFLPLPDLLTRGLAMVEHTPAVLVRSVGAAEVLGAAGLVLPGMLRRWPTLTPLAALALALMMALAVSAHLMTGAVAGMELPMVLGALSLLVAWGRWCGWSARDQKPNGPRA